MVTVHIHADLSSTSGVTRQHTSHNQLNSQGATKAQERREGKYLQGVGTETRACNHSYSGG